MDTNQVSNRLLEWVKVLGPIILSWPTVALIVVIQFEDPLLKLLARFTESSGSKAEIGPIKIELGPPVLPPQHRAKAVEEMREIIDLASEIGSIRDTGPEGTTVGFSLAYTLQAAVKARYKKRVTLSPRGIYILAKKYDEWPGENYEGTSLLGGLKALRDIGAYTEGDWPYESKLKPKDGSKPSFKISGFSGLEDIEQILNALREGKAVATTIQVTADFDTPDESGRVIIKLPLKSIGDKAITIVGYRTESAEFKFANDWGTGWGAQGFGFIKDTDLTRILKAAYIVEL